MGTRRILAGMELSAPTTKNLAKGIPLSIPLNKVTYEINIGANPNSCRFLFDRTVEDITVNYSIIYRTTRVGVRVQPNIHLGLVFNGSLIVSALADEPFFVDDKYTGIRGTLSLTQTFNFGDKIDVKIINQDTGCDCTFRSAIISMYDGASGFNIFNKYNSWDLYTNSVLRKSVTKDGIVNFIGGTNIDITYGYDGKVTISNTAPLDTNTYLVGVNADNLSNVIFSMNLGDDIIASFSHVHTEYALLTWVEDNFDKYVSWSLYTNGSLSKVITTNELIDIVGGTDIDDIYSGDGIITLNSTYTPQTVSDAIVTLTPGDGITGGGSFTLNQVSPVTAITFNHEDTSTQANISSSSRRYIDSVTLDTYGHVTGLTTATETVVNTYLDSVNADNISNVVFTMNNGTILSTSFSHVHTEYALTNHHVTHEIGGSDEIDIDGGSYT
jgi:hypothetical protein